MPGARDHAITSRARGVLIRRWVDTRALSFGSVNGVLYVRGLLRRDPVLTNGSGRDPDEITFLHALESDLRAIDNVKDVVLDLTGFERRGERWSRVAAAGPKSAR